jgi:hypothetical protein
MRWVLLCALVVASFALPARAAWGSSPVTVGSPPDSTPQNNQSETAVAVDAGRPNILAAGANDTIDWRPTAGGRRHSGRHVFR